MFVIWIIILVIIAGLIWYYFFSGKTSKENMNNDGVILNKSDVLTGADGKTTMKFVGNKLILYYNGKEVFSFSEDADTDFESLTIGKDGKLLLNYVNNKYPPTLLFIGKPDSENLKFVLNNGKIYLSSNDDVIFSAPSDE